MSDESILVRGVNWLGDAVMSTPALRRLREAKPEARITLLTHEKLKGLWIGHPAVDELITFAGNQSVFSVGRELKGRGFDLALIFPNSPRSAMECWRARIPRRIGYRRPWRNWMLTDVVPVRADERAMQKREVAEIRLLLETGIDMTPAPIPARAHHVYQYLELVAQVGAKSEVCEPVLHVSDEEVEEVCRKFDTTMIPGGVRSRPRIGINAGAQYGPAKCWPKERFIEAAITFTKDTPCDWWIFGGPDEVELSTEIAAAIDREFPDRATAVSLAGRTSLRELCVALKSLDALITNDSGPMHVAAAVGTPLVAIFGSTSPELTGPVSVEGSRHRVVRKRPACSPCFLRECPVDFRCMKAVSPDRVVTALNEILAAD